jgi:hypothetical protein
MQTFNDALTGACSDNVVSDAEAEQLDTLRESLGLPDFSQQPVPGQQQDVSS